MLTFCATLWNGALINYSLGFQRKELDLTNLVSGGSYGLHFCSLLMVSAGSNPAEIWLDLSKAFLLWGISHPLTKAAASL